MAREVCEIVSVEEEDGKVVGKVAGTVTLDGSKLTVQPAAGREYMFQNLLDEPAFSPEGDIHSRDEPARWFHKLTDTFHGTYLFARMVSK